MNNPVDLYRARDLARQNLILSGGAPETGGAGADRFDFHALLVTLRRRLRLFLAVLLGVFLFAMFLTWRQTPIYSASSQVVIDNNKEQITPAEEQVLQESGPTSVDTEVQVIQSSEMATQVIEALKLDAALRYQPPERSGSFLAWITGKPPEADPRSYDPTVQRQFIINELKRALKVARTGQTNVLEITFASPDPDFSAQVANEYGRQYTLAALERKKRANAKAQGTLRKRIDELRVQAQADIRAVQLYRIQNNLLSNNAAELTEQEVSTYNQELAGARAAAAEDRARLQTARAQLRSGSSGDDVGEALGSSVVATLRTQRAQVASNLANLRARYGPRHPDVIKTQQELADLDNSIQAEINRVISNLEAKVSVSSQRLSSMQGSLAGARGALAGSNRALIAFDDLSRKAAASQGMYEAYLARFKSTIAQEGTETPDARVISWAEVPSSPSSPNIPLNVFLGITLGLGAGIAAAFIAELLFTGLTTGDDVETKLGVRYLGSVPLLSSVIEEDVSPIQSVVTNPYSAYAEALRNLRTSVNYAFDAVIQVVAVTSALPGEGKSTISASLARVVAGLGERVLLIDCDPRRRAVSPMVGHTVTVGLMEVLRGEAMLSEALVKDETSGAWLLPLSATRGESIEFLGSDAMTQLINKARGEFSYIVLDTAPVLPVADTRILASIVDAVIFVAHWRQTSNDAIRNALKLLPPVRNNLAGVVLNQVDMQKQASIGYGDSSFYYNRYKAYYS